jgi:protein-S-isoprenylcysteine O-methyltransferase Ste14
MDQSDVSEMLREMGELFDSSIGALMRHPLAPYIQLTGVLVGSFCIIYSSWSNAKWHFLKYSGLAMMVVGYLGWLTSRLTLGYYFTVHPQAKGLVTIGIYGKIRNPIYVFGFIYCIGVILFSGYPLWYLVVAIVIALPVQYMRAREEARVLRSKFGSEYTEYENSTWI